MHVTGEGTYVVQGKRIADAEARTQMIIPEFEDCVEVTRSAIRSLLLRKPGRRRPRRLAETAFDSDREAPAPLAAAITVAAGGGSPR